MPMHSTALRITGLAQRLEECVLVQSALDPGLAPRGIGLYARLGIDAVQDTGDSLGTTAAGHVRNMERKHRNLLVC